MWILLIFVGVGVGIIDGVFGWKLNPNIYYDYNDNKRRLNVYNTDELSLLMLILFISLIVLIIVCFIACLIVCYCVYIDKNQYKNYSKVNPNNINNVNNINSNHNNNSNNKNNISISPNKNNIKPKVSNDNSESIDSHEYLIRDESDEKKSLHVMETNDDIIRLSNSMDEGIKGDNSNDIIIINPNDSIGLDDIKLFSIKKPEILKSMNDSSFKSGINDYIQKGKELENDILNSMISDVNSQQL